MTKYMHSCEEIEIYMKIKIEFFISEEERIGEFNAVSGEKMLFTLNHEIRKNYSRDFDKYLIYYREMNCRSIFRVSGR